MRGKTDHKSMELIEFASINLIKHYSSEYGYLNPQKLNKKRECINHKTWAMALNMALPQLESRNRSLAESLVGFA